MYTVNELLEELKREVVSERRFLRSLWFIHIPLCVSIAALHVWFYLAGWVSAWYLLLLAIPLFGICQAVVVLIPASQARLNWYEEQVEHLQFNALIADNYLFDYPE